MTKFIEELRGKPVPPADTGLPDQAPVEKPPSTGPPVEYKRHYVRRHAAALMGVTERALQTAIDKGHIRAVKFGNRILVPGSEVRRFLETMDGDVAA